MEVLSVIGGILVVFLYFGTLAIIIVAQWKVYTKANQEGWACLIPFYNTWIMLKIIGKPGWWLALMFVPLVNIVYAVWMTNLLSKSFGKNSWFTVGLIFLPFIFYPILGLGSATYLGPAGQNQAELEAKE